MVLIEIEADAEI